jgi:Tfp pilus assembly protein PilN
MIITLNLISPEQRGLLRQRGTVDELRGLAVSVLFVVIFASTATFSARYLLTTISDLFTSNAQVTVAATTVKELDTNIAKLISNEINTEVNWPNFLARLSELVPTHVTIDTLDVVVDGSVRISGEADTRSDLLKFQQQLQDSDVVSHLYSPVKNLLQPAKIVFELTAQLPNSTGNSVPQP